MTEDPIGEFKHVDQKLRARTLHMHAHEGVVAEAIALPDNQITAFQGRL